MRNPSWFAPVLALCLAGCSKPPLADQPSPLKVEVRRFSKLIPGCGDKARLEQPCFSFQATYPEVTAAALPETQTRLNAQILALLQPAGAPAGFAQEAEQLAQRYASREKPAGEEEEAAWFVRRTAEVTNSTAAALSIRFERTEYLGGTGPSSVYDCLNLDPATGAAIRLDDLLAPGGVEKLRLTGERRFRADRKIPAEKKLSEAGFTFPDDRFALPKRFLLGKRGIEFVYGPSEITPEPDGPTSLVLAWFEIREVVRKGSGVVPKQ